MKKIFILKYESFGKLDMIVQVFYNSHSEADGHENSALEPIKFYKVSYRDVFAKIDINWCLNYSILCSRRGLVSSVSAY